MYRNYEVFKTKQWGQWKGQDEIHVSRRSSVSKRQRLKKFGNAGLNKRYRHMIAIGDNR